MVAIEDQLQDTLNTVISSLQTFSQQLTLFKKRKSELEGTSPIKKRKTIKDPNAPKRPLSSFFQYLAEQRAIAAEAYPGITGKDLNDRLTKQWQDMTAEEKQPYNEAYARNAEAYQIVKKEYEATLPPKELTTKKKNKKDSNEPSKPINALHYFKKAKRDEYKDQGTTAEVTKILSDIWKSLSEDEKKPYKDQYINDLKAYETAYEEYSKSLQAAEHAALEEETLNNTPMSSNGDEEISDAESSVNEEVEVKDELANSETSEDEEEEEKVVVKKTGC